MSHYLVVEVVEGIVEWSIEHEADCPTETHDALFTDTFEGKHEPLTYELHTCGVGQWVDNYGIEDLTEQVNGLDNLPVGRTPIDLHTSYDEYSGEHDAYLYFVPASA